MVLFWMLLALASGGLVFADDAPDEIDIKDNATEGDGVSISLENADLRAVVTALARAHGINVVGTTRLSGEVTLHVSEAPVLDTLDAILNNAGFILIRRDSGIYEVLTADQRAAEEGPEEEPTQMEVFSLAHADVAETATLLVPAILPDDSHIRQDHASRRLVITGTEGQIERAARVIEALDAPVRAVRVFELKYKEPEDAARLLVPAAIPEATDITMDPKANQLVIVGTQDQLRQVEEILDLVDRPVPQVSIRAKIIEIKVDRARSLGISVRYLFESGRFDGSGDLAIDLTQVTQAPTTVTTSFVTERIDAVVDALVQKEVAEVLSEPQIATAHKQKAEMNVVNQVPVVTRQTRVVDQVTLTDEEVSFEETGVKLEVTPRVLVDGRIEMDIRPAVLELTGWTDTEPSAPIIDTREAKTVVTIADGKWVVIGGLIRYNEQKVVRGLPLLQDIPLLGGLFRTTRNRREKSNLVILVSATLLDDETAGIQMDDFKDRLLNHRNEHRLHGNPWDEEEDDEEQEQEKELE